MGFRLKLICVGTNILVKLQMLGSVSRTLVRMEERASKREARTSANAMKDLKAQPVQVRTV